MTKTIALVLVLFAGCTRNNPNYVGDGPGSGSNTGSDGGTMPACQINSDCHNTDTPICDQSTGSAHDTCRGCSGDSECVGSDGTCLPTGACGGNDVAAYVGPTGSDTNDCSSETPCATVGHAVTATTKMYVVLTGTAPDDGISIDRTVTVLGRASAVLTRTSTLGPVVTVTGGDVSFATLSIENAQGVTSGDGIITSSTGTVTLDQVTVTGCTRYGVNASAGKVVMARSQIAHNGAGGVTLTNTSFDIENCFVNSNGTTNVSAFGGVSITNSPSTSDTIAFTTIADNHAAAATSGGILCAQPTNALAMANDVVANNDPTNVQVFGANCGYTFTDTYPGSVITGAMNRADPPLFEDEEGENFHLGSTSTLIDKADPGATLPIDIDGQSRPQGSARDMGADEFMQP
jgi:hypothetical protein